MNRIVTEIMGQYTVENFEALTDLLRPHQYREHRLWEVDYCPYVGTDTGATVTRLVAGIRRYADDFGITVANVTDDVRKLPNPEMANQAFYSTTDKLMAIPLKGHKTAYTVFTMLHEFAHATIEADAAMLRPKFVGQWGDGILDHHYLNEEILAEQTAVEVCDALDLLPNVGRETLWRSAEYLWHFHHYYERHLYSLKMNSLGGLLADSKTFTGLFFSADYNIRKQRLEKFILDQRADLGLYHRDRVDNAVKTMVKYLKEV